MKRILFTTEFSDHAPTVLRYALELARANEATLIMGHGFGKPETATDILDEKEKGEKLLKRLQDFAADHISDAFKTVPVEFAIRHDFPANAIISLAEAQKADVIVISMTGSFARIDQHFSDTTLSVLRRAQCPVLAIPADAEYTGLKRLAFSTDFQYNDLIALNMLSRWSKRFEATIDVVHILESEKRRTIAEEKMEALENALSHLGNIEFHLIEGKQVRQALLEFFEAQKADLATLTTFQRSRLWNILDGSTTRQIAKKVKIPLLVVKAADDLN